MARKPVELNATVIERTDVAYGLAIFKVRPDAHQFTTFVPGQYCVLGYNHPEKGPVQRAYSIASPPQTLPGYLEFYIRFVKEPTSDNPLTHMLFDLFEGERVHLGKKIVGKFTVQDTVGPDDPRMKILVGAGTGLAPFTSTVFDHVERIGPPEDYTVLHGVSYPEDLGYRDQLGPLLGTNNGSARYFPTVSRQSETAWDGHRGRVETFFDEGELEDMERAMGKTPGWINPANAAVMVCGLQGTITNCLLRLMQRGFIPNDRKLREALLVPPDTPSTFFYEQYDTAPILDLQDPLVVDQARASLRGAGVELLAGKEETA